MNDEMQNKIILCKDDKEGKDSCDLILDTLQECNRRINFCCTATLDDGFIVDLNPGFCVDFSELSCCLEARETTCEVNNPCDGILECPVEIQAVRLVGCARLKACLGPVRPVSGFCQGQPCSLNCETITCVDQIIGFTCGKTPPCEPCFEPSGNFEFTFIPTTDECGRRLLIVEGFVEVNFIGCDC